MLNRLRRIFWFVLALGIGYALASGVVAETLTDLYHMTALALHAYRLSSGSSGTVWLLVSGFLLGQGIVLVVRRLLLVLLPRTTLWAEEDAAWDASLLLTSRFGLERYLGQCASWAAQTNPENTQSIALLKISGLGKLNETRGTQTATELLQDIAARVRVAALPATASRLSSLLTRHLPRRFRLRGGTPEPRCAARWSGSTFALAFRGMEVNQAMGIARQLASGIRWELAELDEDVELELHVAFAMGAPGVSTRALLAAADVAIEAADGKGLAVAVDPSDSRSSLIATVQDVRIVGAQMERGLPSPQAQTGQEHSGFRAIVRGWAPVVACFAGVPIVMALGGGGEIEKVHPWPSDLTSLSSVSASGSSTVHLVRQELRPASTADWEISKGTMTQAEPGTHNIPGVEFQLSLTNHSKSRRYVSVYDFSVIDTSGQVLEFSPRRVMRMPEPLDGKWLDAGESWAGWLSIARKGDPVRALVFRPDSRTQLMIEPVEKSDARASGQSGAEP